MVACDTSVARRRHLIIEHVFAIPVVFSPGPRRRGTLSGMQPSPPASVVVDFDVAVPMRDGVHLRANIYRPGQGRWPVLLTRLPYGKDLPLGTLYLDPVQAARQGYVVVVQDTRGRFTSDGEWFPFVHEAQDGFDSIAWAAQQPFADGHAGMYGASYFGFTQWSAATLQPPALKTMVPF